MRTSRVNPTTSSIFRNSRQYLQSNELFYRAMHDGGGQQSFGQQHRKSSENTKSSRQDMKKNRVLKNSKGKLIVKGIVMDGDSITMIQTSLIAYSNKIKNTHNRMLRIHTYRTSI